MTSSSLQTALKAHWTAFPPASFTPVAPELRTADEKEEAAQPMLLIICGDEETRTPTLVRIPFQIQLTYDMDATTEATAHAWLADLQASMRDSDYRLQIYQQDNTLKILKLHIATLTHAPDGDREKLRTLNGHAWLTA